MALSKPAALAKGLVRQGMPAAIADEEAAQWANKDKRRAILRLYRSAKGLSFRHDWARDIGRLPANGTLIWGANDPYVDLTVRSEEHTSELQSLMRISYAVFCLKKKTRQTT